MIAASHGPSHRIILGALLLAACGGGGDPPPPTTPAGGAAAAPAPAAAKPAGPGGKADGLQVYQKVEDLVPADEVKTIRHKFKDNDFALDPGGDSNRDPFQSFVINQPGVSSQGTIETPPPVAKCDHLIATKYALRDLKLVAIMSRGLRRYALFQDTADHGNLAGKGDCLGKEKAQVKEIGDRTVTLTLIPEKGQNQVLRPAEDKPIYLYPPTQEDVDAAAEAAQPSPTERADEPMLRPERIDRGP